MRSCRASRGDPDEGVRGCVYLAAEPRSCATLHYFGWGTIRRYGLSVFQPPGYFCLATSSVTAGGMITSSPFFQFTGVATLCLAVSWLGFHPKHSSDLNV